MTDSIHLAAIRARDDNAPEFWFSANNDSLLARAIQDRRFLLAELDRSHAAIERLRDEAFRLRQRLADLHSAATETT